MAGKLKEVVLRDVHALIKNVSGFEEEDSNFKACERFILSHLVHHRYLSVDSHAIRRSLQGITLKFNVTGLFSKAREFDDVVQKFLHLYNCKDTGPVDSQWCLLSLLLNLANNPSNSSLSKDQDEPLPIDDLHEEEIDWGKYLLEGCEDYQLRWDGESDSEDELEDVPQDNSQSPTLQPLTTPSTYVLTPSQSSENHLQNKHLNVLHQISSSETWLKTHIQHTWWTKAVINHLPLSGHPAAHSAMSLDKAEKNSVANSTVSEHKAVLEILWMLTAPNVSALFMKVISDDGLVTRFCVRPHVNIPSLWHDVFSSLLSSVCEYAYMIKTLKDFSLQLYLCNGQKKVPLTYQAYDHALHEELLPLYELIAKLEQHVHKQDETFTILIIMKQLQPWLKKLSYLYDLHQNAVLDWKKHPNWICATHLLAVLLSHLRNAEESPSVFRMFVKSFKVYLSIVSAWHSEGQLHDWREEFLVSSCDNSNGLLGAVFEKRDWETKMTALGIEYPKVLCLLADYALKAAQPLHVLHQLNRLAELQQHNISRRSLYSWFLEKLTSSLEISQTFSKEETERQTGTKSPWWDHVDRYLPQEGEICKEKNNRRIDEFVPRGLSHGMDFIMNHLSRLEDPLLLESVTYLLSASVNNSSTRSRHLNDSSQDENSSEEKLMNLIKNISEILPLEWFLEKAVLGLPAFWEGIAGSLVADILMSEQQLLVHMQNAQSLFMLQAGHKLQPFISHFFKLMMQRGDLLWTDSHSLSVLLQDCMDSDNFCVSVEADNKSLDNLSVLECIDCLSVRYQVEWPLCAILGGNCENAYNSIFRLLLKLRWGLWNLEHVTLRGRGKYSNPLAQRLMLLRFQLLHVIRSTYSFLCCHIINVLSLQFCESLKQAEDLHKIVSVHDRFLSDVLYKSLQADVPDGVKNAFFQLVVLAENFYLLWMKDQHNVNPTKLANMEACYADCHLFLALALRTLVQEEGLLHLAFLSDLVNWNIPNCKDD